MVKQEQKILFLFYHQNFSRKRRTKFLFLFYHQNFDQQPHQVPLCCAYFLLHLTDLLLSLVFFSFSSKPVCCWTSPATPSSPSLLCVFPASPYWFAPVFGVLLFSSKHVCCWTSPATHQVPLCCACFLLHLTDLLLSLVLVKRIIIRMTSRKPIRITIRIAILITILQITIRTAIRVTSR